MNDNRARLSADQRRSQLLHVAVGLFARHGYHNLSMEQLAEAAGVSKPVLYQHFPSKRGLYLALVADAVAELERQVSAALEGTSDNRERVEGAIGAYFDFVEDNRFSLLFGGAGVADADVRETVERAMARVSDRIGALIAHDAGLSPPAARFLAAGLRGLATTGALAWGEQADAPEKAEAARLLSQLAWRGLGSFPQPHDPDGPGASDPGVQEPRAEASNSPT